MSIEERLEEVEGLLQKTNDWIAQQLRPGIRNLKEAMQTQITELREQLEEERNARLALERKLASQPDVAAINALIAEQLKKHAASLASSSSSSSSSSHSSSSPHSSSASPSVADARAAFSESSDDLFSMNNQAPRTSSSSSSFSSSSSSSSSSSTSNRPLSSTFVAPGTSFVPSSSTPASGGARTPAGRPAVGPARGPASSQPSPKPAPAPAPEPVLTETEKRVAEAGLQQFAAALRDLPLEKLALLEESEYGSYGVNLAPHKKALTTLITALQTELGIAPKPSEVDEKLASIGLDRFANNFRQAGIKTVKQLAQLDGSQYASLGISLPAHRKKLATLILTLQTEEEGDEEDESLELFPTPKPAAAATPKFGAASSFASPKVASGSSTPLSGSSTPLGSSGSSTPAARVRPVSTYDLPRSTASIADAVRDIRDDSSETDWVLLELGSGGIGVVFEGSGSGGFDEFIDHISEGKIQFALLRLIQGDQESRRVKFVFVRWVGPACNGILKAKANTLKSEVTRLLGQFHIEHFAEDFSELTLEIIKDKLKAAAGADYDQGNKGGYSSSASSLKARALDTYRTKEREGTISKPVFASSALPSTTPCDISSRPFVAPPAEARSNIRGY